MPKFLMSGVVGLYFGVREGSVLLMGCPSSKGICSDAFTLFTSIIISLQENRINSTEFL